MFPAAGLTVNKRRGSLDPENVELLLFLRCNWTVVDEWQRKVELPCLTPGVSSYCGLVFRLDVLSVVLLTTHRVVAFYLHLGGGQGKWGQYVELASDESSESTSCIVAMGPPSSFLV